MRGLIYKDLYLIKNNLLTSFILVALMFIVAFVIIFSVGDSANGVSRVAVILDLLIVMSVSSLSSDSLMKCDDGKSWGFYGISLPKGIKRVVGSRYLTILLMYVVSFVICVLNDFIFGIIYGKIVSYIIVYGLVIAVGLILKAIEMPLSFRFGAENASKIRILITVLIVFIATLYFLFGNIEWLMGENGIYQTLMKMKSETDNNPAIYEELLKSLMDKVNIMMYIGLVIEMVGALFWYFISYVISCAVYRKGILRDDI